MLKKSLAWRRMRQGLINAEDVEDNLSIEVHEARTN